MYAQRDQLRDVSARGLITSWCDESEREPGLKMLVDAIVWDGTNLPAVWQFVRGVLRSRVNAHGGLCITYAYGGSQYVIGVPLMGYLITRNGDVRGAYNARVMRETFVQVPQEALTSDSAFGHWAKHISRRPAVVRSKT